MTDRPPGAREPARAEIVEPEIVDVEIAAAEAEYRLLFENAVSGIYRSDPDGRLLRVNPALARMHGYADEAEMLAAVAHDETGWYVDPARRAEFLRRLRTDGRVADFVSQTYRHRTRETFWISESAWAIRDGGGAVLAFAGTVMDATERKETEDRIARIARRDALTGLPNRLAFTESLEAALAADRAPFAVMLLDLDRFKTVNDTLGHPAGDALLQALAGRIGALLGPGEVVARFGGDELALLAPGADPRRAAALAARLIEALRDPVRIAGREIVTGASIGIALAPHDGAGPTELLRAADVALYCAKDEGRDAFRLFAPAMDDAMQERQRLEIDLRAALDRGEFGLAFQPVVCLARGGPVGYEALLRWTHPERGPVAPETFIAIAEETRLIGRLGAWVLAEAAAAAARWPPDLALWVNVSAVQLAEPGFEATLARALAASGLPPARLVLEITETALMEERAGLAPKLERLRASGLRAALDDFGAGYSSLGYLRRFRFDVLKLDRSFTHGLAEPDTAAIVGCVLDLGRRLGLATVAEGVETEAQLDALRRMGCAYVQGRHVGPPVAAGDVGRAAPRPPTPPRPRSRPGEPNPD